jgi:type VI secretion system protein ImpG
MDRRMLRYYNQELAHLRGMGGEFAKEFPKIAGRLALDEFDCADPYVERLLEGFSFLAARVQLKLDAEFPRFTQSLLETVYPHYLSPVPSMAIVQFNPDLNEGGLADGFVIPRWTSVFSLLGKGDQTRCEYHTAHDVTLWPLQLVEARYYTRDLGVLDLPSSYGAAAGVRIRLRTTAGLKFNELKLDDLTLYLQGTGATPMRLYEQFFGHSAGVVVQSTTNPAKFQKVVSASSICQVGFDNEQRLLHYDARSFQGYRLLHEYFAFPQRFMFVKLTDLSDVLQDCEDNQVDIIFLMRDADLELENAIDVQNFVLFGTPAINLFRKRADRIHVKDSFSEFHVVPDRTRPTDFEVYQILGVTGYGTDLEQEEEFLPFYYAGGPGQDQDGGAYYATHRVPRTLSSREKRVGGRSPSYGGSEVFISLVDAKEAPYSADLRQLAVDTLCTNRDLPLHMSVGQGKNDFTMDISAPYESIRCVGVPAPPRPSCAEGEVAWRAISHLTLNYLSLSDTDGGEGAAVLRDMMKLYGDAGDPQIRKQIDGVKSVSSKPIVRRIVTHGPVTFARGLELTVTFDESAFEGTGVFLLGSVLEQFFSKYVSINSFTETVIRTLERGEVMRWPMKTGMGHIL